VDGAVRGEKKFLAQTDFDDWVVKFCGCKQIYLVQLVFDVGELRPSFVSRLNRRSKFFLNRFLLS